MQPMRTPLKTELGLSAPAPKTPRGMTADAARAAVPPRNALRVVRLSVVLCVMFPSSLILACGKETPMNYLRTDSCSYSALRRDGRYLTGRHARLLLPEGHGGPS